MLKKLSFSKKLRFLVHKKYKVTQQVVMITILMVMRHLFFTTSEAATAANYRVAAIQKHKH